VYSYIPSQTIRAEDCWAAVYYYCIYSKFSRHNSWPCTTVLHSVIIVVQGMSKHEETEPGITKFVYSPDDLVGRMTKESPRRYLGDSLKWRTISRRLTIFYQHDPSLDAKHNQKAAELGWKDIRGCIVILATTQDGDEDDVTIDDIANLSVTAATEQKRRAELSKDCVGIVHTKNHPFADVCANAECVEGKHTNTTMNYTDKQFPAHRNEANRTYVYDERASEGLLSETERCAIPRNCSWSYLCANAYIRDSRQQGADDAYLCDRIGPIPVGVKCYACGGPSPPTTTLSSLA